MTPRELASLAKSLGGVVREQVAKAIGDMSVKLAELEQRIANIPAGKDGRDGVDGKDGLDGQSVTIDDVTPVLREWFDAIPRPKDGADGRDGADGKDGRDGIEGKSVTLDEVTPVLRQWFDAIPLPKDGVDGKDGRDGADGKSVTVDDVRPMVEAEIAKGLLDLEKRVQDILQKAIDRMPAPRDGKDGINGKDGRDAFQIDEIDITCDEDDERVIKFAFVRGEDRVERSIRLNHPIYRGIWKEGAFKKGDSVTFGGSLFIAKRDTNSKPETDDSWQLAVKRGRDGRDGQKGDPGPQGPRGPKGEPPVDLQTAKIR
jgi:hypothetical protein